MPQAPASSAPELIECAAVAVPGPEKRASSAVPSAKVSADEPAAAAITRLLLQLLESWPPTRSSNCALDGTEVSPSSAKKEAGASVSILRANMQRRMERSDTYDCPLVVIVRPIASSHTAR